MIHLFNEVDSLNLAARPNVKPEDTTVDAPGASRLPGRALTIAEVAEILHISASKLYQLVASRRIAHYRIGGKIVFSNQDVAAYLASCHVGAVEPTSTTPQVQIRLKHLRLF